MTLNKKEKDLLIRKEEFISKSNKVHKNKYNYTKVVYTNNKTKVEIICDIDNHGSFFQRPDMHNINKHGCPKCANIIKAKNGSSKNKRPRKNSSDYTTESIIKKFNEIFDNRYNYDKTIYISLYTPIIITCIKHGDFIKSPNVHLEKTGCFQCANEEGAIKRATPQKEMIQKFKEKHGDKYDYSKVVYKSQYKEIIIICPKEGHGEFTQIAKNHLFYGCPSCGENKPLEKEETLNRLKKINPLIKYNIPNKFNVTTYISCKCSIENHPIFETKLGNLLYLERSCPLCNLSKGELKIFKYLNENNINHEREKTFPDCKNKGHLRFDFYLPEYNLCIEFDGKQHFVPINQFGGLDSFNYLKECDDIKNKYCKDNNIQLIRIEYRNINNIENILKNIICI